jgi:hypothetical protein
MCRMSKTELGPGRRTAGPLIGHRSLGREIVGNEKSPPAARISAANSLLDRGYGRPESKIDATVETSLDHHEFDFNRLSPERFALLGEILEDDESDPG